MLIRSRSGILPRAGGESGTKIEEEGGVTLEKGIEERLMRNEKDRNRNCFIQGREG